MTAIAFEAKYYSDRLEIVNPYGTVGIVTLWTPVKTAISILERNGVDLSPTTSAIAVVANLYGDGLPQMIRNLLWNPQIRQLVVFGQNLSDSCSELVNLLSCGVTEVTVFGQPRYQICNTTRTLDTNFDPLKILGYHRLFIFPGNVTDAGELAAFAVKKIESDRGWGLEHLPLTRTHRIDAPLPTYKPNFYPSNPRGHTIVRDSPLDAWEEVVFRIMRFGIPSQAGKSKQRLELQNLKVVIEDPTPTPQKDLDSYGFSADEFETYAQSLLDPKVPDGLHYSYGNRIREFGYTDHAHSTECVEPDWVDQLNGCSKVLRESKHSRGAYVSLWHPAIDLDSDESKPCLVSLFFRVFEDKLTLTATFRAHNVMSAWLKNVHGLIALQRYVAEHAGDLPCGAITVISHSISIDPMATDRMPVAEGIVKAKTDDLRLNRETGKRELREDPNGYFTFTTDPTTRELVLHHKSDGMTLAEYRGKSAEAVEMQLARDEVVSSIGHALYIGRQLGRLERQLKDVP